MESTTIVVHAEGLGSGRIEYVQVSGFFHTENSWHKEKVLKPVIFIVLNDMIYVS